MIKTKYVVGDVVVVDGKQQVIIHIEADNDSLYTENDVNYKLSNGKWYNEVDI